MSWRISAGSVFEVSLAPPCSPDGNRLAIPYFSNSSALRDSVRLGTSISFARSPAVSWKRTSGRICSYNSCSGQIVHCLILAHSSVRSLRWRFGSGISPCLPIERWLLQKWMVQAYLTLFAFARIQGDFSPFGRKPTQHPLDICDSYPLDEKACTPEQRGIL